MTSGSWSAEYENHDDGPTVIRTCAAVSVLAFLFVGLRLWARRMKGAKLALDDWLVVVALLFLYGLLAIDVLVVKWGGVGKHQDVNMSIDPGRFGRAEMYLFVGEFLYAALLTIIKISILLLYHRTFPTPMIRKSCYVLGAIAGSWWLAVTLVAFFQCQPLDKIWSPFMEGGSCIDTNQYFLGNSIANILNDALILTLPVIAIWRLEMETWVKVGVAGIFLVGGFVIITSCIRLQKVISLINGGTDADYTLLIAGCWIWTQVESATAVICACLPTLGPFLAKVFGNWMKSRKSNQSNFDTIQTVGGGSARPVLSHRSKNAMFSPFQKLCRTESSEPTIRLWAENYASDRSTTCEGKVGESSVSHDIPMDKIMVRRDISRKESWTSST